MIIENEIALFCRTYMCLRPRLSIRRSEMTVLGILCGVPGVHTPVSLANMLCVSRPMIASHLAALQSAGYVTRVASPEDGRSVYILPTKSGKKLYSEYHSASQRVLANLSRQMGAKKFDTFVKLITTANKILGAQD